MVLIITSGRIISVHYLVKCNLEGREYRVFGYTGKQVRDNIYSEDVARFIFEFYKNPRCAEVYNLGGGKENSCSIVAKRLRRYFSYGSLLLLVD